MKFLAESEEDNREIFNCVSENLTVKDVAEICKKNNKNLNVVMTDDPIPNKGYTLSSQKLKKAGFTKVKNLYGGIFEWKNKGYPVFNSAGKETENVHAFSKHWSQYLNAGNPVYWNKFTLTRFLRRVSRTLQNGIIKFQRNQ